ncbi:uncharacterized protein LOC125004356 isoform X2 [Mugil cephalus]|nr:uncharacterized protein LOC125004356 isoform X2 [Mugil cephalus]
MHPSIIKKDNKLKHTTVSPSVFGCPLCPVYTTKNESVIQKHLLNHVLNAVHFNEMIICRCNLRCRDGGHFHCPFCGTTIIRKDSIIMHLIECKNKYDAAQLTLAPPSQLPSPDTHPAAVLSSVSVEHSYSLPVSVLAVKIDHSYTQTASSNTPAVAPLEPEEPDLSRSPPATNSEEPIASEEPVTGDVPPTHVKCPHCTVVLYKRNLFLHVQRKHVKTKDITAQYHLQSTTVDQSNGLYAVRKTYRGFNVPVHVQRKTLDQQNVTRCEMEDCRQYHLLAEQSGLSPSLCHHVRSLDYCSTTASEEQLDHQVLQEVAESLFFADSTVAECKARQREAEEAHVPLSVLVDLSSSKNHICISVHEPKLHHYSSLGRVFVNHNIRKNTWHCPCAKALASCVHKYIAKWHLFQTHKHLFETVQTTTTSPTTTTHFCQSPHCRDGEKCEVCLPVQKNTNHSP